MPNAVQSRMGQISTLLLGVFALLAGGCDSELSDLALNLGFGEPTCQILDEDNGVAFEVLSLVSEERLRLGLDPLELDDELSAFASDYACTMIEEGFFAHVHPDTRETFNDRIASSPFICHQAGENLAQGPTTAELVVEKWLDSEPHYDNIIKPEFTKMGLGLARSEEDGRLYWVQLFLSERIEHCAADEPEQVFSAETILQGLLPFPNLPIGLPVEQEGETVTEPPTQESDDRTADE